MTCTLGPYCGDGDLQKPDEVCEIGQTFNVATLAATRSAQCNSDCQGYCGDGNPNNDGTLDGSPEDYEGCDLGPITYDQAGNPSGNGKDGDESDTDTCRSDCTMCGDGMRQGEDDAINHGEGCDEGARNVDAVGYNQEKTYTCNRLCQTNPYCGDRNVYQARDDPGNREDCDDGSDNGLPESNCTADCKFKPYCGDGTPNDGEACDDGRDNVTPGYGTPGCNTNCHVNKYCGDGGEPDRDNGEACDWASENFPIGEYNAGISSRAHVG